MLGAAQPQTHDFRSDRPLRKGTLGVHKETIALSLFAKTRLALQKPKALWLGQEDSLTVLKRLSNMSFFAYELKTLTASIFW